MIDDAIGQRPSGHRGRRGGREGGGGRAGGAGGPGQQFAPPRGGKGGRAVVAPARRRRDKLSREDRPQEPIATSAAPGGEKGFRGPPRHFACGQPRSSCSRRVTGHGVDGRARRPARVAAAPSPLNFESEQLARFRAVLLVGADQRAQVEQRELAEAAARRVQMIGHLRRRQSQLLRDFRVGR